MAEMGLGYGSEFQLMRFLGHHREELDNLIRQATGMQGDVEWKDFPYDNSRISGDGELKGIECFRSLEIYKDIEDGWKQFWPQRGSVMNWDAIFTIGDTWFFVEAKANEAEAFQVCTATSDESKRIIDRAFNETKKWLNVDNEIEWRATKCYQLANRLAFICFCNRYNIKAKLLYVSFVNGYWRKNVISQLDWETKVWNEQFKTLGLTKESVKDYLYHIYPDCEPKNK